jgi:hypothetical protein
MTVRILHFIMPLAVAMIGLMAAACQAEQTSLALEEQLKNLERRVNEAESNRQFVLQGSQGWLFFAPEIRSLLAGRFWGDPAASVSRSIRPEQADPLPVILDFQRQLSDAGIDLLVVPVPAKAAVVSERLLEDGVSVPQGWRLDASHAEFLSVLAQEGVQVIDLAQTMREVSETEGVTVYCLTDTHWSGLGVQVAAGAIAQYVRASGWYDSPGDQNWNLQAKSIEIQGDLTKMLDATNQQSESVEIVLVRDQQGQPIPTSKQSEILLLGDSHTLVFHDPSLFALGAGLPDHLAYELGGPVDLIGVRGSGATAARITLARQKGRLRGKKLVIWCFAAREFTEATDGWRKLPLPSFD